MNIESSSIRGQIPSNYSNSRITNEAAVSKDSLAKMAKSSKDARNLELQGVHISVGEGQLIKAIDRAIKALEGPDTMFEMKVHKETNAIIVKVLNKETGETIREIPPEKTLDLVVKMMEFAGILIDEKV